MNKKKNKTISLVLMLILVIISALIILQPVYAVSTDNEIEDTNENQYSTRGLFTSISISLKGGGNGTVIATARNDFTLGTSVIIVYVELYSSETYQNTSSNMRYENSAMTKDLDIYQSISLTLSTNGQQRYWRARLRYKFDDANWAYKETETVLYNANGVMIG